MKRIIKGSLLIAIATTAFLGCKSGNVVYDEPSINQELLDELIENGDFSKARRIINETLTAEKLDDAGRYLLNFEIDKINRIKNEFSVEEEEALEYIKKYIPDVTQSQIEAWINSGALECKKIDGVRKFFRKAPRNLFRIDSLASAAYEAIEGKESGTTNEFLASYLPRVIEKTNLSSYSEPVRMRVKVKMRVMPDVVPEGEVVRMWLPYLHQSDKYKDIKLLNVFKSDNASADNPDGNGCKDYIVSPPEQLRQSLYTEMVANGKDTLKFGYELEFSSYNQYFPDLENQIKPYDTSSSLYKFYTSEREQHIVFTQTIKNLTDSVLNRASESTLTPYEKVKKIWCYINDNYPWAGARDYSTIPNISMYVIKNRHGDCGQVSLLFITMARYAGIPAKWQSGWMLHPENVNLHDWAEVYYEGVGWVPVDQSFGYSGGDTESKSENQDESLKFFFSKGLDAFRYIVNQEYGALAPLFPAKIYPHNDEVDFQMGEAEWRGGNILNGGWKCWMDVEYLNL